jgi:hypothetical protein
MEHPAMTEPPDVPSSLDTPDGPKCHCGKPSATEAGLCSEHAADTGSPQTPEGCEECMNYKHNCLCPLNNDAVQPFLVASAIKLDGRVYAVRQPGRHHNVFALMRTKYGIEKVGHHFQGFLVSDGRFVGRVKALGIAELAGQLLRTLPDDYPLTSEDLW